MNDETIRAGAEATQAIAETGGKGLDLIGKFAKYFDGALTQRGGIAEDNMIFRRAKNRLRILEETEAILQARGIESHSQDVPLKIALPLLTFGSLEEDQSLQKTWARMLANALDANSGVDMRTAYVDILKDLTAFDVAILEKLAKLSESDLPEEMATTLRTAMLPFMAEVHTSIGENEVQQSPPPQVKMSLSNLTRAGCITGHMGWGGKPLFSLVSVTPLGMGLYRACSA